MIADAVHAMSVRRALLPRHHDEETIKLLERDPAALDHQARGAGEVFADLRKLGELRRAKTVVAA